MRFLGAGAVAHALSPDPVEKAADRTLQLAASVAVVRFQDQPLGFFVECLDDEVYEPADGELPEGADLSPRPGAPRAYSAAGDAARAVVTRGLQPSRLRFTDEVVQTR